MRSTRPRKDAQGLVPGLRFGQGLGQGLDLAPVNPSEALVQAGRHPGCILQQSPSSSPAIGIHISPPWKIGPDPDSPQIDYKEEATPKLQCIIESTPVRAER